MATVRYLVNDVDAALDFYVGRLGFELVERWGPPFAMVRPGAHFRNEIVTGPGGRQILVEDPSGNPIELFQPQGD